MNYWKTALAILTLSASVALAEDFKTVNGKEYKDAKVSRVESDGIVVVTKSGIAKVYFVELPKEVQKRFGYDTDKIETEQTAARAAQEKRTLEEKEREGKADADLKQVLEQFQVAERRALQNYQSATKGILSGQVFVATEGGESRKLGAVQVELYDRDAVDVLVRAAKNHADIKIQQLSRLVAEANTAIDQARERFNTVRDTSVSTSLSYTEFADQKARDAALNAAKDASDAALEALHAAQHKLGFYYSGAFYFSLLYSPIQTAETDGDGKFAIEVPKQGSFVIAAKAGRYITQIEWKDIREHYYWLQPVSLEGQQQRVQNLSNKNLTSTGASSSLIRTSD